MKNSKGRDAASEELRKRQKLIRRREKRRLHLPQREKHNYVLPLQLKASKVEDHDPIQPFTLAPCQLCVIGNCSGQGTGHESPIIVAISSRGKSPAACGIFCNINSPYNKTFMLHGETLNRREIEIHSVIAALKQIIIKTHSKYLMRTFAGRRFAPRYSKLAQDFDNVVGQLGDFIKTRPVVKFWRPEGRSMAQQFAESALQIWKEAKAQEEAED